LEKDQSDLKNIDAMIYRAKFCGIYCLWRPNGI